MSNYVEENKKLLEVRSVVFIRDGRDGFCYHVGSFRADREGDAVD